ncbi:hypothetical protein DFH11DRAFT_535766 [Phellopilus nigrolimitatus]|nr:hypothetical protein DFH11DRAFT_535766 [Phellopilus nigrolimitatus]
MLVCTAPASLASSSSGSSASSTRFASCSLSASASFPFPGPLPCAAPRRELYLRTLEQEREEILAAAYAAKTRPSSPSSPLEQRTHPALDPDFRESVRQRQARLEFLRRQDFARRLAHRGLQDAAASAYAIKRLPPPRARPAERLHAALTIQRAFRAHLALRALAQLPARLHAARAAFLADLAACGACAAPAHTQAAIVRALHAHADALQILLRSALPACSSSAHPRVRAAAGAAAEALRGELARLARARLVHGALMLQGGGPFWEDSPSSDEEEEEEEEEEDGDCAWSDSESESECSLETVEDAPQHAHPCSRLFVVREEDEDEDEDEDEGCRAAALSALFLQSQSHQKQRGHRRLPASYRPRSHSPVARSPALDSIPEDDAEGGVEAS